MFGLKDVNRISFAVGQDIVSQKTGAAMERPTAQTTQMKVTVVSSLT